jgi:hypothetical protein
MNIARRTLKYEEKGFSREKVEINALMENSMFAIFRDFPDAFLLFGGATLGLFHESVRHSADLDLLARGTSLPTKAEAFLLRRIVNARDAYEIHVLLQKGAVLSPNLSAHLEDAIHANEIDGAVLSERIALINLDLCSFELKPVLPPEIYAPLEESEFGKLLFEEWL